MKIPTPIASFDRAEPAEIVASRLRDTCFEAAVQDTSGEEFWTLYGLQPKGHFKVIVPLVQSERALSWLREFDAAEQLLATALRCPGCGSTRVEFPQLSHGEPSGIFPPVMDSSDHDYHCGRCKQAWPVYPEVPRVATTHLAA